MKRDQRGSALVRNPEFTINAVSPSMRGHAPFSPIECVPEMSYVEMNREIYFERDRSSPAFWCSTLDSFIGVPLGVICLS